MTIFIVGYSRSGTKMMNKILEAMGVSDIVPEVHFFEQIYNFESSEKLSVRESKNIVQELIDSLRFRTGDKLPNGIQVDNIESEMYQMVEKNNNAIELYLAFLKLLNKKVLLDTTPKNAYFIRKIYESIPDARFIYMVRDPRDCILSQSQKWRKYYFQKKRKKDALRYFINYHPGLMARFWKNSLKELREAQKIKELHKKICVVKYEDVTMKPYKTADELSRFLDTKTKKDVDLSFINSNNSYKWKRGLSKSKIYAIESDLTEEIKEFGYEVSRFSLMDRIKGDLMKSVYYLKIPLIVLVNLSRTKNIWKSFRLRILGSQE